MSGIRNCVHWLHAQRKTAERRTPRPKKRRTKQGFDGSHTLELLWSDPELRQAVSEWFEATIQRKFVFAEVTQSDFRSTFESTQEADMWAIDVVDSGTGLMQVLPVIVACEIARRSPSPLILSLEEPDSNLDVDAQVEIAHYLVGLAASMPGHRFVLETHSPTLMLGIQLALARGSTLTRNDAIIYSTVQDKMGRSHSDPIEFNDRGQITGSDNWPDPQRHIRDLSSELVSLWYSGDRR